MTTFGPLFVPTPIRDSVSGRAWIEAMLEVERTLARVEATAGIVPAAAAAAIGEACRRELPDFDQLLERGRAAGNPVEPLVRSLRDAVGGEAARFVHLGATSQDVMDTAAMLVARGALELILADLDRLAAELAILAERHRSTPLAARTLLQQAVPTTFGCKAAGWLVAVLEARGGLARVRDERLTAQLGGAAGTLAVLGDQATGVLGSFASELGLAEPVVPWHTNRTRIAELGGVLTITAGVAGKIGLDLVLLAQTEVGEVREGAGGRSSTMPQKHNPVQATLGRACAELVRGYASVLTHAMAQEHERAAGAWQAEWDAMSGALAYTGGAVAAVAGAVGALEVDVERMRRNLELTDGLIVAERVASALAGQPGGATAQERVQAAAVRSAASGRAFEAELRADGDIELTDAALAAALDPTTYLGATSAFVDRALDRYGREMRQESEAVP